MTDCFRLGLMKTIHAKLATITIANGYQHDLTNSVFRGRLFFGESDPLPMVALVEPPATGDQKKTPSNASRRNTSWDILVQGWVDDDDDHHTDPAYNLAADVTKCLATLKTSGNRIYTLGESNAFEIDIGEPLIRPPDETSAKACFYILITLKIVEDMANPFG